MSKGAKVFTVFSTSKDHGQGSGAMCGCILVDFEKLLVSTWGSFFLSRLITAFKVTLHFFSNCQWGGGTSGRGRGAEQERIQWGVQGRLEEQKSRLLWTRACSMLRLRSTASASIDSAPVCRIYFFNPSPSPYSRGDLPLFQVQNPLHPPSGQPILHHANLRRNLTSIFVDFCEKFCRQNSFTSREHVSFFLSTPPLPHSLPLPSPTSSAIPPPPRPPR